eukprot:5397718-Amphidinium_carterae.1
MLEKSHEYHFACHLKLPGAPAPIDRNMLSAPAIEMCTSVCKLICNECLKHTERQKLSVALLCDLSSTCGDMKCSRETLDLESFDAFDHCGGSVKGSSGCRGRVNKWPRLMYQAAVPRRQAP